jgi:hypothetical protein
VFTLRGGTVSRFLANGDFNGDGKLDVLLAGRNASAKPVLVVFLGNGTGGFGVPIVTRVLATIIQRVSAPLKKAELLLVAHYLIGHLSYS